MQKYDNGPSNASDCHQLVLCNGAVPPYMGVPTSVGSNVVRTTLPVGNTEVNCHSSVTKRCKMS